MAREADDLRRSSLSSLRVLVEPRTDVVAEANDEGKGDSQVAASLAREPGSPTQSTQKVAKDRVAEVDSKQGIERSPRQLAGVACRDGEIG